jgi:tRNA pseudouridine13 synthase
MNEMTSAMILATLPCAHGGPAGSARIRVQPEDFIVHEWLGFTAEGDGEHWLLKVRKRGANTQWVAKQLARAAGVPPRDVGFAGLKDRDAVTTQSFSVPARMGLRTDWVGTTGDGFEVIEAQRHRRKLQRGALKANDFELTLRDFTGDAALFEERVRTVARAGVPNYFGPQRFGRNGSNLTAATRWFAGGAEPRDRFERGFALSAARSAIFNAVCAVRVGDQSWNRLQVGDVANLDGSGSVFAVAEVDAQIAQRCAELDIHPTGPLHGRASDRAPRGTPEGASQRESTIGALERAVIAQHQAFADGLIAAGVDSARRALRARVANLDCAVEGTTIRLRFRLGRGVFATAVLHELIEGVFAGEGVPEEDE